MNPKAKPYLTLAAGCALVVWLGGIFGDWRLRRIEREAKR